MNRTISKSILGLTLGLCISSSVLALNSSTIVVKNFTKDTITIKVYDTQQTQVADQTLMKNAQSTRSNWVSSKWLWENDFFDSIDVFYKDEKGEDNSCGTIEPQPITWSYSITRTIFIKECDAHGFKYSFTDTVFAG